MMDQLVNLQKQFLCAVPVKEIQWEEVIVDGLYNDEKSYAYQKMMMDSTVGHQLMKKFPLKRSYQISFLRNIINKLESNGQEVADELYATYCSYLNSRDMDEENHYRHFLLYPFSSKCVTLKESCSLISQGTTGLCSWQASMALADWCLQNECFLQNKNILELGSGVGLTGLAAILCCQPSSYSFSDCHHAVLNMLRSNVILNVDKWNLDHTDGNISEDVNRSKNSCTEKLENEDSELSLMKNSTVSTEVLYETTFNNTDVRVLRLPWEDIPTKNVAEYLTPDLVLAADIIFDASLFEGLFQAFCYLLKGSCSAFLACTVRNEETLEAFLKLLRSGNLVVTEEQLLPPKYFYFSNIIPVKLYKITDSR